MAAWMAMASSASGESLSASSASSAAVFVSESSSVKIGHQLVRFDELGIELEGFVVLLDGFIVEAVGADESEAEIGLRVFRIAMSASLKRFVGIAVVEALVQQAAPADAVDRVLGGCATAARNSLLASS